MQPNHVRIMTDNTTAVACINKQGSTRSNAQNEIARHIWDHAMKHGMWVSAAHIPGVENSEADEASRVFNDTTEWTINDSIFQEICKKYGMPTIDLFASRLNFKVQRYCAWEPDPGAVYIDSFMYDWGQEKLCYAFPLFIVIHMVIQKLIQDEAAAILVVPAWHTQAWYTLLDELRYSEPMFFTVKDNELFLPFRKDARHPLTGQLKLMAVLCKGRHLS